MRPDRPARNRQTESDKEAKDVSLRQEVDARIARSERLIRQAREQIAFIDAILERCRTMRR